MYKVMTKNKVAFGLNKRSINLPSNYFITNDEVHYIARKIKQFINL